MLEIKTIEAAAFYMKHSLEKYGFKVEATSAPSATGLAVDDYRRYIALTQRILDDCDNLKCYLTYRCTKTTAVKPPKFSSYQVLDANYDEIDGFKWHLKDFSTPEECFKKVYDSIVAKFDAHPLPF